MDEKSQDIDIEKETEKASPGVPLQDSMLFDAGEPEGVPHSPKKNLARTFRQTGRIVSLCADVSDQVQSFLNPGHAVSDILPDAMSALRSIQQALDDISASPAAYHSIGEKIRSAVESHVRSVEHMADALDDRVRMFDTYVLPGQDTARSRTAANDIQAAKDMVDTLGGYVRECSELTERADVISLNISLEAYKADTENTGSILVADRIKKSVADIAGFALELNRIHADLSREIDISAELIEKKSERTLRLAERIKELKNALLNESAQLNTIKSEAGPVAESIEWLESAVALEHPLSGELAKTVAEIMGRIEGMQTAVSSFPDTEDRISGLSETLEKSSSQIMPDESLAETLDAVIAAADDLNHACEYPADSLDKGLKESAAVLEKANAVTDSIKASEDTVSGLSQKIAGFLEVVRHQSRVLKDIRESRTGHRAILQDVIALHQSPVRTDDGGDGDAFNAESRRFTDDLDRIAGRIGLFAEKLDLIALIARLEISRSGESDSGFASLAGDIETVGAGFAALGRNIHELGANVRKIFEHLAGYSSPSSGGAQNSNLTVLQSVALPVPQYEPGAASQQNHLNPETGISEQHRMVIALCERISSVRNAAETASDRLERVKAAFTGKRRSIEKIITATDRISSVGSDLYPKGT